MTVSVQPARQAQSSEREPIEIVESAERASSGIHLSVSGNSQPQYISFLTEVSEHAQQAFARGDTTINVPLSRWSAALEQKFARLAARVATGAATKEQSLEFQKLQADRRRLYLARSGSDVLRAFEERQRTAALVLALQKYVEFTSG